MAKDLLEDISLSNARRSEQQKVALVNLDVRGDRGRIFPQEEFLGRARRWYIGQLMGWPDRVALPRVLVFKSITIIISLTPRLLKTVKRPPHTFRWMKLARCVSSATREITVLGVSLALELLTEPLVLCLVLLPPAQTLIVIEYDGTYRLFSAVLSHHVVVDTSLQVARIELGDPKARFGKDGAPTRLLRGVVHRGVPGAEALRARGFETDKGRVGRASNEEERSGEGGRRAAPRNDGHYGRMPEDDDGSEGDGRVDQVFIL